VTQVRGESSGADGKVDAMGAHCARAAAYSYTNNPSNSKYVLLLLRAQAPIVIETPASH
jgi:hypothetical protein